MSESSEIQREVAVTHHGEIEYETVTCASCGSDVPKQTAKRFVVGSVRSIHHWGALGKREYEFETTDYQEGWACEYCRNDSVIDFPLKSITNPHVVKMVVFATVLAFLIGLIMGGAI